MSKSYKMLGRPPKWVSAHRENVFQYKLPKSNVLSYFNSGGKLRIVSTGAFLTTLGTLEVGSRIFITTPGSVYYGFHYVETVNSSVDFVLSTDYASSGAGPLGGSAIYLDVPPIVSVYSGYSAGDLILTYDGGTIDLSTIQPRTLLGTFAPETSADGYVYFDICAYLKAAMISPYKPMYNEDETNYIYPYGSGAGSWLPTNYNRIEVVIEGNTELVLYAANASVKTTDLRRYFTDTGRALGPSELRPVTIYGGAALQDFIYADTQNRTIN